jgi:hypothetical protein
MRIREGRLIATFLLFGFFLLSCLPISALAGIDPEPFHILIENRTDRL